MTFSPTPEQQPPTWERDIRAREEALREAFLAANIPALEGLLADGYVVNSPLQAVLDKRQLLELLRTGRIRHTDFQVTIERIERSADVVVVMGRDTVIDPPDGIVSHRRFTNIWTHDGAVWRSVARHAHVVSRGTPGGPA
jgi:hypothetical protein